MRDFVSPQANPSDEVSTRNDFLIIADSASTEMEGFANAPVSLLLDMHNLWPVTRRLKYDIAVNHATCTQVYGTSFQETGQVYIDRSPKIYL